MNTTSNQSQELLSSKDAGAILGYTHDYISRLCRQNKMVGVQKGREWYVTQAELDAFKGRHEIELQQKKKELSKKFSRIRLEHEAKKRKAREEASITHSDTKASIGDMPSIQKSISFNIPKQFVALAALTFIVFGPSIFDTLPKSIARVEKSSLLGQVSSTIDKGIQDTIYAQATAVEPVITTAQAVSSNTQGITSFNSSIDKGIQDTIYTQALVVEPVTTAILELSYVAGGFALFAEAVSELPKVTYVSLWNMGNAYLTLYYLQGGALYESGRSMNTMGASVLWGYELVGESFYLGGQDLIGLYSKVLHIDSSVETSQNAAVNFTANVSAGFGYAKETIGDTLFKKTSSQLILAFNMWTQNVRSNVSAMQSNINAISHTAGAYIGSVVQLNLIKKDANIRSIEIKD